VTNLWKRYRVTLQIEGEFAASVPKTEKEIKAMLEHRMPTHKPVDAQPIEDLAAEVVAEVGASNEEVQQPGWATFKRDEDGLYYEGRCVRGHVKDCALQVSKTTGIAGFKAKVANHVYVEENKIYLGKDKPDGIEKRFIQVMTKPGPRSTFKFIDYVLDPKLVFVLRVFNDGVITKEHLETIFEYGGIHGIGQERGQSWGRYRLVEMVEL